MLFFEFSAKYSSVSMIDEAFHQLVLHLPNNNSMELSSVESIESKYHISIPERQKSNTCC